MWKHYECVVWTKWKICPKQNAPFLYIICESQTWQTKSDNIISAFYQYLLLVEPCNNYPYFPQISQKEIKRKLK